MENQYYRTFIGIPVKVGDGFLNARKELIESLENERISWVAPENYHVTIRFLGEVNVSKINTIGEALREYVNTPRVRQISMDRPGSFGPGKKPRVVWIGFKQDLIFEALRREVDLALESCGFPGTDQSFRAHLTLGRVRGLKDIAAYYKSIESMKSGFREQFPMEKIVLYRSETGSGQPVYTPLYEIEFQNGK